MCSRSYSIGRSQLTPLTTTNKTMVRVGLVMHYVSNSSSNSSVSDTNATTTDIPAIEWHGVCDDSDARWCSFHTDCEHELKPVVRGKRVVLSYEVHSVEQGETIIEQPTKRYKHGDWLEAYWDKEYGTIEHDLTATPMLDLLDRALTLKNNTLILLNHLYPSSCEPKHLKGFDRNLYETVRSHYNYTDECEVKLEGITLFTESQCADDELGFLNIELKLNDKIILEGNSHAQDNPFQMDGIITEKPIKSYFEILDVPWFFNISEYICLFSTAEFKIRGHLFHGPGGMTGNEGAEVEYVYQFYVLRVTKLNI